MEHITTAFQNPFLMFLTFLCLIIFITDLIVFAGKYFLKEVSEKKEAKSPLWDNPNDKNFRDFF